MSCRWIQIQNQPIRYRSALPLGGEAAVAGVLLRVENYPSNGQYFYIQLIAAATLIASDFVKPAGRDSPTAFQTPV